MIWLCATSKLPSAPSRSLSLVRYANKSRLPWEPKVRESSVSSFYSASIKTRLFTTWPFLNVVHASQNLRREHNEKTRLSRSVGALCTSCARRHADFHGRSCRRLELFQE